MDTDETAHLPMDDVIEARTLKFNCQGFEAN